MLPVLIISLAGFTASIGQILVLRELLVLFYGNELSTGVVLACWMIWTGAGSRIAAQWSRKNSTGPGMLAAGIGLLSLSLPVTILWIRVVRTLWGIPAGELVSPGAMLAIALSSTAIFCCFCGALFALSWSCAASGGRDGSAPIGVYLAEAAGAGLGGLFYYFLLLPAFTAFETSIFTGILVSVGSSIAVFRNMPKLRGNRALMFALAAVVLNCAMLPFSGQIDLYARKLQWGGGFRESADTPLHNLALLERYSQYSLFANGLWLCSIPDPQTSEPAAHLPLLQHPNPQRVLLIGDFSPGLISEILKHPGISSLDCVQPDSEILNFARRVLPTQSLECFEDPRLRFHHLDPKQFMASTDTRYSVIIMGAGEPVNAEMNRFYTVEFFSEVRDLLEDGGVFSFSIPSAPDIIGFREAALLRSMKRTLDEVFGSVVAVPGESARFFAGRPGSITKDSEVLIGRLGMRGLDIQYLRDFNILELFNPFRISYMESVLGQGGGVRINKDFHPVCYLFGFSLWGAQIHPAFGRSFEWLSDEGAGWIPIIIIAGILAAALILRAKSAVSAAVALNTAISGASLIILEIILVLSYQIISGAMYREIALVISFFMTGLVIGSGIVRKFTLHSHDKFRILLGAQAAIAAYAVGLIACIENLRGFLALDSVGAIFAFLALLAGMLGGFQFAAAVIATVDSGNKSEGASLYAADLMGSAGGAFIASLFLLPVLGIQNTLLVTALAGVAASFGIPGKPRTA